MPSTVTQTNALEHAKHDINVMHYICDAYTAFYSMVQYKRKWKKPVEELADHSTLKSQINRFY